MTTLTTKSAIATVMLLTIAPAQATYSDSVYERWQLKRLLQPGDSQLRQEQKGKVFIYEGIKDKDIDHVMSEQFDRLGTMMFTRTVITDESGEAKKDPETGLALTEEDGC